MDRTTMKTHSKNRIQCGKRRNRLQSGFTLAETIIAAFITVTALSLSLASYFMGIQSWSSGEANISTQEGAQQSLQLIERTLRQSMTVVVDANGEGLTYQLPQEDSSGTFTVPLIWDGVTRRIALSGTNIVMSDSTGFSQILCSNVVQTDPTSVGNAPYVLFTPNTGSVTRSLSIEIVSQTILQPNNQIVYGRRRDELYLRNVQQLYH